MTKEKVFSSLAYFLIAGVCEIGGGYMIWKALKDSQPLWVGLLGGIILAMYGVVATLQTTSFGRTYAAYGGIFIVMSLLWGWKADKIKPDTYDMIGAIVVLIGTAIIFYSPRR